MTTFLLASCLVSGQVFGRTPIEVRFAVSPKLVAGLPLALPYRFDNRTNVDLSTDLGAEQHITWVDVRLVDAMGKAVAHSSAMGGLGPSRFVVQETFNSPGPRIEPGKSNGGILLPHIETLQVKPGTYTLSLRFNVAVRTTFVPQTEKNLCIVAGETSFQVRVVSDPQTVASRAQVLVGQILRPTPKRTVDADDVRELSLIDHAVALPLLRAVPASRWTTDQVGMLVYALGPDAGPAEADFLEGLLAKRTDPELGDVVYRLSGAPNPIAAAAGQRLLELRQPRRTAP